MHFFINRKEGEGSLLAEELNQKLYAVSIRSTEVGLQLLSAASKAFLERNHNITHGKQTLKNLYKQRSELQDISLHGKDVKAFERELKKYGVDYSVKRDATEINSYMVFFKARDISLVDKALKSYTAKQLSNEKKPSIKERMEKAIKTAQQRIEHLPDKSKTKAREER